MPKLGDTGLSAQACFTKGSVKSGDRGAKLASGPSKKSESHAAAVDPPDATIIVDIGGARVGIGAEAPAALVMATLRALRS